MSDITDLSKYGIKFQELPKLKSTDHIEQTVYTPNSYILVVKNDFIRLEGGKFIVTDQNVLVRSKEFIDYLKGIGGDSKLSSDIQVRNSIGCAFKDNEYKKGTKLEEIISDMLSAITIGNPTYLASINNQTQPQQYTYTCTEGSDAPFVLADMQFKVTVESALQGVTSQLQSNPQPIIIVRNDVTGVSTTYTCDYSVTTLNAIQTTPIELSVKNVVEYSIYYGIRNNMSATPIKVKVNKKESTPVVTPPTPKPKDEFTVYIYDGIDKLPNPSLDMLAKIQANECYLDTWKAKSESGLTICNYICKEGEGYGYHLRGKEAEDKRNYRLFYIYFVIELEMVGNKSPNRYYDDDWSQFILYGGIVGAFTKYANISIDGTPYVVVELNYGLSSLDDIEVLNRAPNERAIYIGYKN